MSPELRRKVIEAVLVDRLDAATVDLALWATETAKAIDEAVRQANIIDRRQKATKEDWLEEKIRHAVAAEEYEKRLISLHGGLRPELRKLFDARWEQNEPGYRLLADR